MEFIIAVIIFVALLAAWFILPSSKTVHSKKEHEPVKLTSAQQV